MYISRSLLVSHLGVPSNNLTNGQPAGIADLIVDWLHTWQKYYFYAWYPAL